MDGACGKGGEAQVGWLKGMSAQHQVRANSHSKHEHVSAFSPRRVARPNLLSDGMLGRSPQGAQNVYRM